MLVFLCVVFVLFGCCLRFWLVFAVVLRLFCCLTFVFCGVFGLVGQLMFLILCFASIK